MKTKVQDQRIRAMAVQEDQRARDRGYPVQMDIRRARDRGYPAQMDIRRARVKGYPARMDNRRAREALARMDNRRAREVLARMDCREPADHPAGTGGTDSPIPGTGAGELT